MTQNPAKIIEDVNGRMDGAIQSLLNDYSGLRTGRASAGLLNSVRVDAYGSLMPLDQLATVSVPEARLLSVQVWDQTMVSSIEKAIANSNLGLNPSSEGNVIRIAIPNLSEERRKELVKAASEMAEKARIAIRNVRRDGMDNLKKLEKDGEISQDEQHGNGDKIQKITDDHIKTVDETLQQKEKEIMET